MVMLACLAAGVSGCGGYSLKSSFALPDVPMASFTQPEAPSGGQGTLIIGASIEGLSCAETRVTIATARSSGYAPVAVATIMSTFGNGERFARLNLPQGEYHVVQVACRNGANVIFAGAGHETTAVPWKASLWDGSLATVALGASEVVNAGEVVVSLQNAKGFSQDISGHSARVTSRALEAVVDSAGSKLVDRPLAVAQAPGLKLLKCRLQLKPRNFEANGGSTVSDAVAPYPGAKPMIEQMAASTADATGCIASSAG
jgi:hypothetical protein